jgi:excisionase family DNA binding protein
MPQQLYSVDQVADLLGLHVKTIRGYVRDGRLNAVRIGKQYRIARDDLEAFTGHSVAPARETARRHRHIEVSTIVQIDAISPEAMGRLSNTIMAAVAGPPDGGERLHVETVYNEERGSLRIILLGDPTISADLLKLINTLVKE